MRRIVIETGEAAPLGARATPDGINFALFSAHAEQVELCLFDEAGGEEVARLALRGRTADVWHGFVPGLCAGQRYGYRVHGPYDPERGHRFNPHKLLIDPYTRALDRPLQLSASHFGYRAGDAAADLGFDDSDSARDMPKCIVTATPTARETRRPHTLWRDTVIYELHVRGFTKQRNDLPPGLRGTLKGLGEPSTIAYLRELGVSTIELLPVQAIADEPHLMRNGLRNYWGYNSIAFFALEPRYVFGQAEGEFRALVEGLHEAGIELLLDVVFNHTGEGDQLGPTLSFRGIDNASYYLLKPQAPRFYENFTGTGNTLNAAHPAVRGLILDSLRYWAGLGVDGFRFDLASTLARADGECAPQKHFIPEIGADPQLAGLKLIAEPWDAAPDGYRLGGFPPPWSEWNDRYRDGVRRFWRGDAGRVGDFATRITGSSDVMAPRGPLASVNFITAHDGFTLQDLVSHGAKHNEANLEANADGVSENYSANWGAEGPTDDAAIRGLRAQQKRNLIATLLLSQGVPMLTAGDERGHTQGGNNNPYGQDNATTWVDWSALSDEDAAFAAFVARLVAFRKAHRDFRRDSFFTGKRVQRAKDISWLHPRGREMRADDWNDANLRCFGCTFGSEESYLLLFNAGADLVQFLVPAALRQLWTRVIDTEAGDPFARATVSLRKSVALAGHSLALLQKASG